MRYDAYRAILCELLRRTREHEGSHRPWSPKWRAFEREAWEEAERVGLPYSLRQWFPELHDEELRRYRRALVDLERAGFIERWAPGFRRTTRLKLTPEGRAAAEGLEQGRRLRFPTMPELPDIESADESGEPLSDVERTPVLPATVPDEGLLPQPPPTSAPLPPDGTGASVRFLAELKTEPLGVAELADYFGVGRNRMTALLPTMAGAERFGSRWRLPLTRMPPSYHLAAGLLVPSALQVGPAPFGRGALTSR